MSALIIRFLKDRKSTIFIYCIAIAAFLWMYIALFPSMSKNFDEMKALLDSFPKEFLQAFGMDSDSFVTFEGYIGSEQFTFIWPIMIIAFSASFAGNAFASEVEKGTMEILLSQPISRIKLFFSRYLAGFIAIFIFVFVSIASVFPLAAVYGISLKTDNFMKLGFVGLLFSLAVYSMAILFSSVFSEKGKANFVPAGIIILMYVLNIISGLNTSLVNFKYFSFFYYFNPSRCLVHGEVNSSSWFIFIAFILIFSALSAFIFNKKDISR